MTWRERVDHDPDVSDVYLYQAATLTRTSAAGSVDPFATCNLTSENEASDQYLSLKDTRGHHVGLGLHCPNH